MISIDKCKRVYPLQNAALVIANKVAFDKGKGFSKSWDGKSYWEYAANLDSRLPKLERHLIDYKFSPTSKQIKHVKWKERVLYISTWEDKIVETWLSRALNKLLSNWFSRRSYAYRIEKIGIDNCQRDIINVIRSSKFIARRDIRNFFYTIDHELLLNKLATILDQKLLELVTQRVQFEYYENDKIELAKVGVPFGSPIACLLANIYLTAADHTLVSQPAHYFRYADDFLIASNTASHVLDSADILKNEIEQLRLELHPDKGVNLSFEDHQGFTTTNRFKYLGLEYWHDGVTRLPIEKKRKIAGIFKRALRSQKKRLLKIENLTDRIKAAIACVGEATLKRIRYAAIIDYYLKHVEDEEQLKILDREIAEMVISTVLDKPFKMRDFKKIPYKTLREYGLISLRHRSRLHKHGQLNVPFLSMYNSILFERFEEGKKRRSERINQIKLARKLKKINN